MVAVVVPHFVARCTWVCQCPLDADTTEHEPQASADSMTASRIDRLLAVLTGIGVAAWIGINLLLLGLLWLTTELAQTWAVEAACVAALFLFLAGGVLFGVGALMGDGRSPRSRPLRVGGVVAIGAPAMLFLAQALCGVLS